MTCFRFDKQNEVTLTQYLIVRYCCELKMSKVHVSFPSSCFKSSCNNVCFISQVPFTMVLVLASVGRKYNPIIVLCKMSNHRLKLVSYVYSLDSVWLRLRVV